MQFFIQQKSFGKRKSFDASVIKQPIQLDITDSQTASHIRAQDFIVKLVTQQVNDFNGRIEQHKQALLSIHAKPCAKLPQPTKHIKDAATPTPTSASALALSQQTIDTYLVNLGKVDFANIANLNTVSLEDALINTLQAFEDGLFIMFVDEVEVTDLEQTLSVFEGCTISFIRLTFLAGGWF